jgi:hypothetical protein
MTYAQAAFAIAGILFLVAAAWPGSGSTLVRVGLAILAAGWFLS